ncbi:MAG: cyclic 2,3-diphosphoglycerate synthase [Gammaproteobacteria bacterium]|nr:cyclic 2,3-diphosphoglycerate synthase [Gammaproteobacteria bacterium]
MARARTRVVIMGAAGRDFHDFNVVFRDDASVEVVAFTAAQIPGIGGRVYPPELSGPHYPTGIPVIDEADLADLCRRERIDRVVFAYSDVSHQEVMRAGSRALATGADFVLLGPRRTMLGARRPVISVCAARTGCGKSQTVRYIADWLAEWGMKAAILRHPMPYGDLLAARVQRFASSADLAAAHCTNEEREEYEPHIAAGHVVFAGVDYAAIVAAAEREADILLWDGGNNDFSFVKPDLAIAVADALRPEQVDTHHPGETVVRMADVVVLNKVDAASSADVQRLLERVSALNPNATIVRAASPVALEAPELVMGRRVLVVEDGPTITHGGMPYGAGYVAAIDAHAHVIVDPRDSADDTIRELYERYPHIARVLPAVGYDTAELDSLRRTINAADADVVVSATPCDLAHLIPISKPVVRARYAFAETAQPGLAGIIEEFVTRLRSEGSGSASE